MDSRQHRKNKAPATIWRGITRTLQRGQAQDIGPSYLPQQIPRRNRVSLLKKVRHSPDSLLPSPPVSKSLAAGPSCTSSGRKRQSSSSYSSSDVIDVKKEPVTFEIDLEMKQESSTCLLDDTDPERSPRKGFPVRCNECQKFFSKNSFLKQHQSGHNGSCLKSDPGKKQKGELTTEEAGRAYIKTLDKKRKRFRCKYCQKTFVGRRQMVEHLAEKCPAKRGYETFVCPTCKEKIIDWTSFKIHLEFHSGFRPFVCPFCNLEVTHHKMLIRHVQKFHLDSAKDKRLKSKSDPRCPWCRKQYERQRDVRVHMEVHLGGFPYLCGQCDRRFSKLKKLDLHLRNLHGEKPLSRVDSHKKVFIPGPFLARKTTKDETL